MNEPTAQVRERLEEEAITWHARLTSGDMTDDERDRFEAWRRQSPAHSQSYRKIEMLWGMLGEPLAADREQRRRKPTTARPLSSPDDGLARKGGRRRQRLDRVSSADLRAWGWGLATAAALFLAVGFALFPDYLLHPLADYRTRIGEQATVALADGSFACLNTDTALNVHMAPGERRVVLLRGEAEFEVARDSRRPFRVQAGNTTTEAVGTRFVVRYDGRRGAVTLLEGKVRTSAASGGGESGKAVDLKPGDRVAFDERGPGEPQTIDPVSADAWRRGRLLMNFVPLREVVEEINRYRRGTVRLLSPALAAREINVAIDIDRIDDWLDVLTETLSARVRRAGPVVLLYSEKR